MPRLLRFLGLHIALGSSVGVATAAFALLIDAGGLKTLMAADAQPYLAMFMLFVLFSITFGSVAAGAAVMRLPWGEAGEAQEPRREPDDGTSKGDGA
jgi:hypothetical protein